MSTKLNQPQIRRKESAFGLSSRAKRGTLVLARAVRAAALTKTPRSRAFARDDRSAFVPLHPRTVNLISDRCPTAH